MNMSLKTELDCGSL